jgi:hypothetical protein
MDGPAGTARELAVQYPADMQVHAMVMDLERQQGR